MTANAKKKATAQTAGAQASAGTGAHAAADAIKPELETLVTQLRAGLVAGATPAAKQQAATVCRLLLVALDTQPGQPMSFPGFGTTGATPAGNGAPAAQPNTAAATPPPATSAPTQPPGLLDLVTTWAKQNLETSPPPHEHVPYVGTAHVTEMIGAAVGILGGRP